MFAADLVFLDVETGEIVVGKRIDREQTTWLNFTVRATDSGRPPRTANADVYVQVRVGQLSSGMEGGGFNPRLRVNNVCICCLQGL